MNVDSMFLVKVFPSLLIYVATRAAFTADYLRRWNVVLCFNRERHETSFLYVAQNKS